MMKRQRAAKIVLTGVLAWILIFTYGCDQISGLFGGGGESTAPVKTTTKTAAAPAPPKLAPMSAPVEEEKKWSYDPTEKLDPFFLPAPPELLAGQIEGTEPYELEQMLILGVMQGSGMDRAYVLLPDGTDRIVKLNDKLGKMGGVVTEIGKDYIIVEETYIKPGPDTERTTFVIKKKMELQDEASKGGAKKKR